ncbi:MAG TPA: DUF4249 family protein [Saprospiraceae bacterium]|nr:DUF4249 domain-containing protein [Candidatus Parvibacillus calidus]MBX2938320.1 DUF4249 domain-containing protein [Saprospiraceae bacterium]MBX7179952.1 DUF4249 domain-containing protein [Saprospiraceae bacterium]MCB0592032.1 DUF4249 domain-containing protein [Saprospiraceae bacterium]MCC7148817.1 DUF4249 domain-containing protein [Saprospiraceae bacterium]
MNKLIPCLALMLTLTSCNLSKEVDIDLPQYTSQPVVECYLIPGQRYELLLTHSNSFFDPLTVDNPTAYLASLLETGAMVRIIHGNDTVVLEEKVAFNSQTGFISNYSNEAIVPEDFNGEFSLSITLRNGSQIAANTHIPSPVGLDSIRAEYSNQEKTRAILFAYYRDNRSSVDYYRRLIHIASLDSVPMQNYVIDDKINTSENVAFGAFYERRDKRPVVGDTLIFSLYHITEEYYRFSQSKDNANIANGNPFGQPGQIKSNVVGPSNPIGIFTGFVPRRDTLILQ